MATRQGSVAELPLLDKLLDAVIDGEGPWQQKLEFLRDAALIYPCWTDNAMAQRFVARYCRLGKLLAEQGNFAALADVVRAQLASPYCFHTALNINLDDDERQQILRLIYSGDDADLQALCGQLRLGRWLPTDKPSLLDWAETQYNRPRAVNFGNQPQRGDWRNPLVVDVGKEAFNVLADLQAALDGKAYRDACQVISGAGYESASGLLPDSRDASLLTSLPAAVTLAMRDYPGLRSTMDEQFGAVGRLRVLQAISDGSAAGVEAATVQFSGTEAAGEAHAWLADRALAAGAFAQAFTHYRESLRTAAPALRARVTAAAQLAAAMMGQPIAGKIASSAEFGGVRMASQEFAGLLDEMRSARSSDQTASLKPIESAVQTPPPPSGFVARGISRLDGDLGDSSQNVPGDMQGRDLDPIAEQCGFTAAGDLLLFSNRFQVSRFDLKTGQWAWRLGLGGDQGHAYDWPLMPMRPLVTASRIFVRRLTRHGPTLGCLEAATGKLLWNTSAEGDRCVASDPLMIQDELLAITVARSEQELMMSLTSYDPSAGTVINERPLVRMRENWLHQRSCQVLALDDTLVVVTGGGVFRVDMTGRVQWLRQEIRIPSAVDRGWMTQEHSPPCVVGNQVIVSQPGVRAVTCLELETGRLVWQQPVPEMRRLLGVIGGNLVVRTDRGFEAFSAETGKPRWQRATGSILNAQLTVGPDRLIVTQSRPAPTAKISARGCCGSTRPRGSIARFVRWKHCATAGRNLVPC